MRQGKVCYGCNASHSFLMKPRQAARASTDLIHFICSRRPQPTTLHQLLLLLPPLHLLPSLHPLLATADPRHALAHLPNLHRHRSHPPHRPPQQPALPASESHSGILECLQCVSNTKFGVETRPLVSNPDFAFWFCFFFFSALDGFLLDLDPISSSAKGAASSTTGWGGE